LIVVENGGAEAMKCFARVIPGSAGVPTRNFRLSLALLVVVSAFACASRARPPHAHLSALSPHIP
jgi:hypothetical protein